MTPRNPIVVGVDGSAHSLAAADLAADEAARRDLTLEIVHAFAPLFMTRPGAMPPDFAPVGPVPGAGDEALRAHAEELLHQAATRVRQAHPDLPVVTRLRDGTAADVLTTASGHAALLVVGHRGSGGFTELLTGSVSIQLASHARCPVLIVRGQPAADAPVVVGVDGSDGARQAARFAAETATRYEVPLVALFAWPRDPAWSPEQVQAGQPPPEVPDEVNQTVSELTSAFPALTVRPQAQREQPAHEALIAASAHARLVVVGSRGLGGFKGLLLGSVSQALINHARCPVAVVGPETA